MSLNKTLERETHWSRLAHDFQERSLYVIGRREYDILGQHLGNLKGLGDVLELGCGDGMYTRMIAPNSDSLMATDWSEEMVAAAKAKLAQEYGSVQVQRENCFDLSFDAESFDTVVMANLLHVIPEPDRALREGWRVLRPGGRIVILSFTRQGMSVLSQIGLIYRYLKTFGRPPTHSRRLEKEEAVRMAERQGFSVQRAELIGHKVKSVFVIAEKPSNQ
jgi:ubiquinone/menaquinone biosynthesis C-methylase UbiE